MSERTTDNTIHIRLPSDPEHGQLFVVRHGRGRYFVSSPDPESCPVVTRTANQNAHPASYCGVHASSGCFVDEQEVWLFEYHGQMRCWLGWRQT